MWYRHTDIYHTHVRIYDIYHTFGTHCFFCYFKLFRKVAKNIYIPLYPDSLVVYILSYLLYHSLCVCIYIYIDPVCIAIYFWIHLKIHTVVNCITIPKYSLLSLPGNSLQRITLPTSWPSSLAIWLSLASEMWAELPCATSEWNLLEPSCGSAIVLFPLPCSQQHSGQGCPFSLILRMMIWSRIKADTWLMHRMSKK